MPSHEDRNPDKRRLRGVEAQLADAETAHADDPARAELIARARRFKAGWYELAESLSEARRSEWWKRWGFPTFDEYCRRELHLRRDTVDKLTGSFTFLRKKAPEALTRDGHESPLPSYQAVDFWRRAEEQAAAPAETMDEIRRHVLEEGTSAPKLARLYRNVVFPVDAENDDGDRERRTRALRAAAEKLAELLSDARGVLPAVLVEAIREPLSAVREALAEPVKEKAEGGRPAKSSAA